MSTAVTDVIDETIGPFGKYQATIIFLMMLGSLPATYQMHNIVFIIPTVDYVCMDDDALNSTNHCPCENPQYDTSEIVTSVTSEWNLICDRTVLASLAQSIIQLGSLVGSIVCGYLSDRYGRKPILCVTFLLSSLSISLSAAASNIWIFIAIRFVTGFPVGGVLACYYVYIVELTGTSFRTTALVFSMAMGSFSYFSISLISYFVQKWRYIQLCSSAPWILTVAYFWIVPESPRWLITVGRTEEAIALLTKISRRNGLPSDHIALTVNETIKERSKNEENRQKRGSFKDLFKTSTMRVCCVSVAMLFLINSHLFYGINQYVGRLKGNLYFNTMLSALCLILSVLMFKLITKYFKRMVGLVLSFSITSVSLILFILTQNTINYLSLPFIIISSLGVSTSLVLTYLFALEIFPTIVRSSGLGFSVMTSKVGGFLAPFIVNIGIEWVTITIFITLLLLEKIICYTLPETKDMVLQNTIEQTEKTYGNKQHENISRV